MRKIYHDKGRLILKQRKFGLIFFSFFLSLKRTFYSNVIAKVKFLRVISLAGTRWEKSLKYIKSIPDGISLKFDH